MANVPPDNSSSLPHDRLEASVLGCPGRWSLSKSPFSWIACSLSALSSAFSCPDCANSASSTSGFLSSLSLFCRFRRREKINQNMPAIKITARATPTPIPIFLPLEDEPELPLFELSGDVDGAAMAKIFCGEFSVNEHCDREKLRRSQSTMRYLKYVR